MSKENRFLTGSDFSLSEAIRRGFSPVFDMPIDACSRISAGASRRYESVYWSDDGKTGRIEAHGDQFATFRDFYHV